MFNPTLKGKMKLIYPATTTVYADKFAHKPAFVIVGHRNSASRKLDARLVVLHGMGLVD